MDFIILFQNIFIIFLIILAGILIGLFGLETFDDFHWMVGVCIWIIGYTIYVIGILATLQVFGVI